MSAVDEVGPRLQAAWQEVSEDLRRYADHGRILIALWMGVGSEADSDPDFFSDADFHLNTVLFGEGGDLTNNTGWVGVPSRFESVSGPFTRLVGRWSHDDLKNWFDASEQLSRQLAKEPFTQRAAVFGVHDWELYLFRWLLGSARLFEDGLEGYWFSAQPDCSIDLEALLTGDVNTADKYARRMREVEREQLHRFFQSSQVDLQDGYYCLLLRDDVRRVSRRAIEYHRSEASMGQVSAARGPSLPQEAASADPTADDVSQLEASTPAFDKHSGQWVKNKRAAALDGVEVSTLAVVVNNGEDGLVLVSDGLAQHTISPDVSQLFRLFITKVAFGSPFEYVAMEKLNCAVKGDVKPEETEKASDVLRSTIHRINRELSDWCSPPDGEPWIRSKKRKGYYLNESVSWSIGDQELHAELTRYSKSVFGVTTDPLTMAGNTPAKGQRLTSKPSCEPPAEYHDSDEVEHS